MGPYGILAIPSSTTLGTHFAWHFSRPRDTRSHAPSIGTRLGTNALSLLLRRRYRGPKMPSHMSALADDGDGMC